LGCSLGRNGSAAYIRAMSSIRPWRDIARRKSRQIMVGSVPVGGDAPVTVQTMTNSPTENAAATIDQIRRCEEAGVDIIRVSCPTAEATAALKDIVRASNVRSRRLMQAPHACASTPVISAPKNGSGKSSRRPVRTAARSASA
jgi:(E)-4-hydroxy-3-methylbut-2-enyl-diphosphate synthase